jgi:hypothetical protein
MRFWKTFKIWKMVFKFLKRLGFICNSALCTHSASGSEFLPDFATRRESRRFYSIRFGDVECLFSTSYQPEWLFLMIFLNT